MKTRTDDFSTAHLRGEQRELADKIAQFVAQDLKAVPHGGGCQAFHSPQKWKARGESFGQQSDLILCHDGGDLARFCNMDYEDYPAIERFRVFLEGLGYYVEQQTSWYSAVYRIKAEDELPSVPDIARMLADEAASVAERLMARRELLAPEVMPLMRDAVRAMTAQRKRYAVDCSNATALGVWMMREAEEADHIIEKCLEYERLCWTIHLLQIAAGTFDAQLGAGGVFSKSENPELRMVVGARMARIVVNTGGPDGQHV